LSAVSAQLGGPATGAVRFQEGYGMLEMAVSADVAVKPWTVETVMAAFLP